jgi:hypothetical protein
MPRISVLLVVAILLVTAAYEALVAFGVIQMGSLPGEGPPGSKLVGLAAAAGSLGAALVSAALIRAGRAAPAFSALLAPAAGVYLLARFYTFDSYYLPSLIRYSKRDFVPPVVVFVLVGLSLAAGLVTLRRRRAGLALSVPLILACALTAFLAGAGH